MIGVVLVTHGSLGQSLIEAVELIAGKQERVRAIGLHHGDGVEQFEQDVKAVLEEMDEGDGVLGFVDFVGGTPANVALKCMQAQSFPCVAGVNMPVLVEALTSRDEFSLAELEEQSLLIGRQSFVKLEDLQLSYDETEQENF